VSYSKEPMWSKEMQDAYVEYMRDPFSEKFTPTLATKVAAFFSDISVPKEILWTKADWQDLYETLRAFKVRMIKRHVSGS
jgi:hypothetical protein